MYDVVMEFWNAKNAEDFDANSRVSGRMEAISRVAELAKPHLLRKGTVSIELGCGTGLFAEVVGSMGIVGVDLSSAFLAFELFPNK